MYQIKIMKDDHLTGTLTLQEPEEGCPAEYYCKYIYPMMTKEGFTYLETFEGVFSPPEDLSVEELLCVVLDKISEIKKEK